MKKTGLLILTFFAAASVYAGPQEAKIFDAFFSGNDAAFIKETSAFVAANPSRPETHFYLRDLYNTARIEGPDSALAAMREVKKKTAVMNPSSLILLRRIDSFCDDLEFSSRKGSGRSFAEKYKPVLRWNVSPLFRKFGKGDLDHRFQPEFSFTNPGVNDSRQIMVKERSGYVRPERFLYPSKGAAYFSSSLSCPGSRIFRIESNSEYECFINGNRVLSNRYSSRFRNVRNIEVSGAETVIVSIKIDISDDAAFRVTIMDADWRPLSPEYASQTGDVKNGQTLERDDPPYDELNAEYLKHKSAETALRLGWYFSEYDDLEAVAWYEKSLSLQENPAVKAIYASECERLGGLYQIASLEAKGKEEFSLLHRRHPECAPAANAVLREKFRYESRAESVKDGFLRLNSCADFDAYEETCSFLEGTGDKTFLSEAVRLFAEKFPASTVPILYKVKSLEESDPAGALDLCRRIVASGRDESAALLACRIMARMGDYSGYSLMNEYIDDLSSPAAYTAASTLISGGRYSEARSMLLKMAAEKDDPKIFVSLGRLKMLSGSSPDLFWEKAASLEPASRFPSDFLAHKAEGKIQPLLSGYRDSGTPDTIVKEFLSGKKIEGTVLFRSSIQKIFRNRSGRYFFEEIIYLRGADEIERYGEYRIPFDKNLSIVQCSLLSRDGSRSESYARHDVDGEQYLTVTGLAPDLLLHVSYEVDNYAPVLPGSALICSGSIFINSYDEQVEQFISVIDVPFGIDLFFSSSAGVSAAKKDYDGGTVWTLKAEKLPAEHREPHGASPEKILGWYSYSESETSSDLFEWYKGLWPTSRVSLSSELKGSSPDETIRKVADYLSRLIVLEDRSLFSPDKPEDVLFRGKGSAEDKVFCARAMLLQSGIQSYPALVLRKGSSAGTVNSDIFSSAVLFIPGKDSGGTWLDFSHQYCPAGVLSSENENAQTFILRDDGTYVEKIARSSLSSSERYDAEMSIDPEGESVCSLQAFYSGRNAVLEKYSGDNRYIDELVGFIASDFHKSMMIYDSSFQKSGSYGETGIILKGKIPGFALIGNKGISLKPFFHHSSIPEYLSGETRTVSLLTGEDITTEDHYQITLPAGFQDAVVSLKRTVSFDRGTVVYSVKKEKGSPLLTVERSVRFPECEINPENYGEFLRFCSELRSIEEMMVTIPGTVRR